MQTDDTLNLDGNIFDIAVWDLETTDLEGDFGRILCGSIWSLPDDEWYIYRVDDYDGTFEQDEQIALDIRDRLEDHTMTVGYYSKGFDIPFLNTRLSKYHNRQLERHFHIDPIYYYRGWRGIKPRKSSLETVAEFLDIERKPEVDADTWVKARSGVKSAINEVVDRNKADVRITKKVAEHSVKTNMIKNLSQYP